MCAKSWYSSCSPRIVQISATATSQAPPIHIVRRSSGSRTTALRTRWTRLPGAGRLIGKTAETALAPFKGLNCLHKFGRIKVGPIGRRRIIFAVGSLPDQKVRETELAAGPHDQIGVRHAAGIKMLRKGLLGDILGP